MLGTQVNQFYPRTLFAINDAKWGMGSQQGARWGKELKVPHKFLKTVVNAEECGDNISGREVVAKYQVEPELAPKGVIYSTGTRFKELIPVEMNQHLQKALEAILNIFKKLLSRSFV